MKIIEEIKIRRKRLKITQEEVASKAGVARPHYSKIEKGEYMPSIETVEKMAEAVGCELVLKEKYSNNIKK